MLFGRSRRSTGNRRLKIDKYSNTGGVGDKTQTLGASVAAPLRVVMPTMNGVDERAM